MTRATLARTMMEAEFKDWQRYAAKRMLPWRRVELHLAQIAMFIATTMGGAKDVTLSDFMFEPPDDSEPTAEDEAAFFEFKPRKKKEV